MFYVLSGNDLSSDRESPLIVCAQRSRWARNATLPGATDYALAHSEQINLKEISLINTALVTMDIQMAVGNQLVAGIESKSDITDDPENREAVNQAIKIVSEDEFNPLDRYGSLHPSYFSFIRD